jgi:hypothetical protein
MSSPDDPLIALWQTAPKPNTHDLVEDLQRLNRLHHRLDQSVTAILCGIAILLMFEEATGRVGSHGVLSVIWTLGLVIGLVWHRRARGKRAGALTLDTVSLLKVMIARAKSDLLVARCLYAGVPLGALAGFWVMKLVGPAKSVDPRLQLIQVGAGVAALTIMIVAGVILARSRHDQAVRLSDKLKSITDDL